MADEADVAADYAQKMLDISIGNALANPLKPGIEGTAGAVDVDDQRCVIRRQRFSLPRVAIDLGPDDAVF